MKSAIYAFSGDPITYGHMDIISRSAKIFDEVIAAIGSNPLKNYLFTTDERLRMAHESLSGFTNVRVTSFSGLLADFAYDQNVNVIIRGLRNAEDFNFELMLHHLGESQNRELETFLMPCRKELSHISSSAAKALQLEQGMIPEYVPINVKQKLEQRISGQMIIGVTGLPGAGKSHLCAEWIREAEDIDIYHLDTDVIGKEVIIGASLLLRQQICELLGIDISEYSLDKISALMFDDLSKLKKLNELLSPQVLYHIRKGLYGKRGIILLESALFAEMDLFSLCNNNIILLDSGETHIAERGHSEQRIQNIIAAQFTLEEKRKAIENKIAEDRYGQMICIHDESPSLMNILDQLHVSNPQMIV